MDPLLEEVGSGGKFQALLAMFACLCRFPVVWSLVFMAFGNLNPGWRCADHKLDNTTHGVSSYLRDLNLTSGRNNTSVDRDVSISTCKDFSHCREIEFLGDTSTIVTEWNLVCDRAWIIPIIISIQMAGSLLGNYVSGDLSERFGRKTVLYTSVACHGLLCLISIFSVSWEMFAVLRFLIGFVANAVFTTSLVYPPEFMNLKWRAVYGSFPLWNSSAVIFALAAWSLRDWRHLHIVITVLSFIVCIPAIWVPESIRWLSVKGKVETAQKAVDTIAQVNGRAPPGSVSIETIALTESDERRRKAKYHWRYLFIKGYRGKTIVLNFTWFTIGLVYYAIAFGITSLSGHFYINLMLFSLCAVPLSLLTIPIANILGRNWGKFIFFSISSSCCAIVVVVHFAVEDSVKGIVIMVLALTANISQEAACCVVSVYNVEAYPTVIRNLSYGFVHASSSIGGIVAPYLVPSEPEHLFISYAIMSALLLICAISLFLLPETKGQPMEDVVKHRTVNLAGQRECCKELCVRACKL